MTPVDLRFAWTLGLRDLRRYFNNPTGYVFVTLFILLSAGAAFWRPRFFSNNLANLDQLNEVFPYLLLFFVPALTMGAWSEERKQGTDELLLTMPAADADVVLGKVIAIVGIYSIALLLSVSHIIVLRWLGRPDPGLLASDYLGYWMLGALLIPVALLASLATSNATIAFILGALFCAVPLELSVAAKVLSGAAGRMATPLSALTRFNDFARGVVSLGDLLYFLLVGGGALYLNVLVLAHRRRSGRDRLRLRRGALRAAAVAVIFWCVLVLADRARLRVDLTAGRIHSLSAETRQLVTGLPADRVVTIQAFVSADVPEAYVQTREDLLSVLSDLQAIGGSRVAIDVFTTEPYSEQARFARERYDIEPRSISDSYLGQTARDVYLAVALTSGGDEEVIGFFDRGLSAEYEIARAIRVVSRARRKRIGIIDSDVKIFGGVDFRNNEAHSAWSIVDELRKQYDVVEITPMSAIKEQVDALLVLLPSRLSQSEIDLVMEPILRGTPTMIVIDPLPAIDLRLAPAAQLAEELDPYRKDPVTVRRNYGDVRQMLLNLGITWVPARIGFDGYNPHPDMEQLPAEAVFVGAGSGNPGAFNGRDLATAGLHEVLLLYPGCLAAASADRFTFNPLLSTGPLSGTASFFDVVRPTPSGLQLNASFTHQTGRQPNIVAAHVQSKPGVALAPGAKPIDVIAVADLDFIADNFFDIRASAAANASFDNITFFLNAIDELAGDDSFIALRNHRVRLRALERVERETRAFMERRMRDEQKADADAQAALAEARNRLKGRIDDLNRRSDLDDQAKQAMVNNLRETEERRFRLLEANIDAEKNRRILISRETMEAEVGRIRGEIRLIAVLVPPMPVLLLGAGIFIKRTRRENASARAVGRLRLPT